MGSVDSYTGCGGEDAIEEGIVGEAGVVQGAGVAMVQQLHHISTYQRHHQPTEETTAKR